MEFTEEELQELELYLSANCPYLPEASPSRNSSSRPLSRNGPANGDGHDDEYEYEAFENRQNWDPEAIYYDLHGNVVYQPCAAAQKDLSDALSDSLRLRPVQPVPVSTAKAASDSDAPICRYYPACRFGPNCRYRHPSASTLS